MSYLQMMDWLKESVDHYLEPYEEFWIFHALPVICFHSFVKSCIIMPYCSLSALCMSALPHNNNQTLTANVEMYEMHNEINGTLWLPQG